MGEERGVTPVGADPLSEQGGLGWGVPPGRVWGARCVEEVSVVLFLG